MKILILSFLEFVFLLVNLTSCHKEESNTLPPETHIGSNTFGCLINGKIWQNGSSGFMYSSLSAAHYRDYIEIYANNTSDINIQHFNLVISKAELGKYYINSKNYCLLEHDESTCKCIYQSDSLNSQENYIRISYIDTINLIVSGTFGFTAKLKINLPLMCVCDTSTIKITEGRFDLSYFKY